MKRFIVVILCFLLFTPVLTFAEETNQKTSGDAKSQSSDSSVKALNTIIGNLKIAEDAPDWLKRINFKFEFQDKYKPTYELETVQPLYMTDKDAIFMQFNDRLRDSEHTFNLGMGYRNIVVDWLILGVNAFYDYTTYHDHRRYGFGFEALGKRLEARFNTYFGDSHDKEVSTGTFQRVMGGYDFEVGGSLIPVRALDELKIYAGYQFFNAKYTDDLKTYQVRVTYPITPYTGLEVRVMKDEGKAERYYAALTIGLDVPHNVKRTKDGKDIDLKQKLLQPVQRVKDIIVEQYSKSAGGFTVKIKRGN